MERKKEKRHNCRECAQEFEEYKWLRDHYKEKHGKQWDKVRKFIDETGHVGEVNE